MAAHGGRQQRVRVEQRRRQRKHGRRGRGAARGRQWRAHLVVQRRRRGSDFVQLVLQMTQQSEVSYSELIRRNNITAGALRQVMCCFVGVTAPPRAGRRCVTFSATPHHEHASHIEACLQPSREAPAGRGHPPNTTGTLRVCPARPQPARKHQRSGGLPPPLDLTELEGAPAARSGSPSARRRWRPARRAGS